MFRSGLLNFEMIFGKYKMRLTVIVFHRQYGTWMSETRMENARDIIDKYLMKSLDALNTDNRNDIRLKVYCDIAKYADAEYKQVCKS